VGSRLAPADAPANAAATAFCISMVLCDYWRAYWFEVRFD